MEGVPISDLCDELALQPTVFYRWQKEFFENGAGFRTEKPARRGISRRFRPGDRKLEAAR